MIRPPEPRKATAIIHQNNPSTQAVPPAIQRFFELLYADAQDGWLVLSRPDPNPTHVNAKTGKRWLQSTWLDLARTSLAHAAAITARLSQHDTVYFGVCLQRPESQPASYRRSTNAGAYLVPGCWADIDLAYGAHAASSLPRTDTEALDLLFSLPAEPSVIVHSRGGMYPFWLFREPYLITTPAEHDAITQLSAQFAHTLVVAGNARGWTLDAVGDLARVLRPAGSVNFKYGTRVEVLHESAARYNPSDFDWVVEVPPPARTTLGGTAIAGQPDLVAIAEAYGTRLERKSSTELAGPHPQHGSSTGDNFNVNLGKGLWKCWRHGTGGDALILLAVCTGLLPCEDAKPGCLSRALFPQVLDIAQAQFGWTPPHEQSPTGAPSPVVGRSANIVRYHRQIHADPYFGAPGRRGTGITPAVLVTEQEMIHG